MELVAKLDDLGKPAWIGLMVLGFIIFWPVGLGLLAYLIWSGRMGCKGRGSGWGRDMSRFAGRWDRGSWSGFSGRHGSRQGPMHSSGNHAFDEYREEMLKRLEEEQKEFGDYLERLRMAKDKAEFEQFMADRRSKPAAGSTTGPSGGTGNGNGNGNGEPGPPMHG